MSFFKNTYDRNCERDATFFKRLKTFLKCNKRIDDNLEENLLQNVLSMQSTINSFYEPKVVLY